MAENILKKDMPIAMISRAIDIPRSSMYYRSIERSVNRNSRVSGSIETEICRTSEERTTYGYRKVWALPRSSDMHVNIKTVRRIMRRNNPALPYAKHKSLTG